MAQEQTKIDFSELIAENFGANATYVETLLARWRSDPSLVDDSWRTYFEELIGANGDAAVPEKPAAVSSPAAKPAKARPPAPAQSPSSAATSQAGFERIPIRGPALKIVENMEASLAVPTATSQRRIPVKLLDENRRHNQSSSCGKRSGQSVVTHT